jgi:hypothetical protein
MATAHNGRAMPLLDRSDPAATPAGRHRHRQPRRRQPRRRPSGLVGLGLLTVVALAGAVVLAVPRLVNRGPVTVCGDDALQSTALAGMANFADWLERNGVSGYVGEVGWPSDPDGDRWAALANTWYDAADAIGLPVTAWAAARWPANYQMAIYRHSSGSTSLNSAGTQAKVVQSHATTDRYLRGVVVAGGSFGAGDTNNTFSGDNPGRYGYDYSYETADSYTYLARHGVKLVRLAVAWERLQPVPNGPLDQTELGRIQRALEYARQAKLQVILDLHNYGSYALGGGSGAPARRLVVGSTELPIGALADLWTRLAEATRDDPVVVGYDVMNEPVTLAAKGDAGARLWEQASQAAVDAIRHTGSTATIAVSGYAQTAPAQWGTLHPRAWISDPLNRVIYEAHTYFDKDSSGHYAASYADELQRAAGSAPAQCQSLTRLTVPSPLTESGGSS